MTAPSEMKLGDRLLVARRRLNLEIEPVAAELRIKPHYLRALENSAYGEMPSVAHGKGFLRTYAQYLGLAAELDHLQELYQRETVGEQTPVLSLPQPLPEGSLPSARMMGGALVAAILLYVIWYSLHDTATAPVIAPPPPAVATPVVTPEPAVAPPPVETPTAPAEEAQPVSPVAPPFPVPGAAPAAAPAPVNSPVNPPAVETVKPAPATPPQAQEKMPAAPVSHVVVRAVAPAWIQVYDPSGGTVYAKLLSAGQEYQVPDQPGLKLMTGNGAGVVLVRDGVAGKPLGRAAEVVRNVRLSAPTAKATVPHETAPTQMPLNVESNPDE